MSNIPEAIAAVIKAKADERQRADEEERRKKEEMEAAQIARNQTEWEELYQAVCEALPLVADYIRTHSETDEPSKYSQIIFFNVPGLAPINTSFQKQDIHWVQKRSKDGWYRVVKYEDDAYSNPPEITERWWWNAYSIEEALYLAANSEREHEALIAEHEERKRLSEAADREAEEREAAQELQAETDREIETDERATLFGTLMDDPVAVALVKIFAAVRAERSGYDEQISALNDNLYDMDARYSRKLNEARQATDAARRETDDARTEAESQRSDVYALEAKLKKAKQQCS